MNLRRSLPLLTRANLTRAALALASVALAACLAPSLLSAQQPTRSDAEKDPILKAMLTELDRTTSQLVLPGFQKPFFVQYRVEDLEDFATRAGFGASLGSNHNTIRIVRVTVLVGDYKTDSSSPRGDGAVQLTALDNDPIALRSSLWAATDAAYKAALAAYAQKQAELKQIQTPPQSDDLSHEKPVISLAAPLTLHLDEPAWTERIAALSGLYRTEPSLGALAPDIQQSAASFEARITNTRMVNSEGAILRKSEPSYTESFGVGLQAADGMHLDRSQSSVGLALADIDTPDVFRQHAVKLIASLGDLRAAPIVDEEYHGPVLLSADASADILRQLLGSSVLATRPRLGTDARTNGPFASSYHTRVLPDFLNVVDNPSLKVWDGKNLTGAYDIDDEGVPAQAVPLVTAGKLENYLIGREPIRDFPQSNGHARASIGGPAHPALGVLKITAENGLSRDDLQNKLLALAKDRGLASAYYVDTLGGPLAPRLLYRITPDGKRELVRGAHLADLDQRALRTGIEAAGKDLWVANSAGEIPETVLAPALLLDDVTIRRANEKNERLPFYPPPQ
ncbi:MAG TPA: metallopeptidase TldD-related protein [Terracidiphilus sp.]|jgi:predicted Zn-dependent protease|nr:metallopeptidase TldD-related protein [Terracidiphilus sp.]